MAKEHALPSLFQRVSKKLFTPYPSILVVIAASMGFVFLGDLKTIANLTNFTIFSIFILVNASLIYLRLYKPADTNFKVPGNFGKIPLIPAFGIVTSCFMITYLSLEVLIFGGILIVFGIVIGKIWQKYSRGYF
jgi:APA family basic amino acid/polyamine antiporter